MDATNFVLVPIDQLFAKIDALVTAVVSKQATTVASDEFITQEQACKLLKCSKGSLITWERNGHITAHRIGPRRVLYNRAELYDQVVNRAKKTA